MEIRLKENEVVLVVRFVEEQAAVTQALLGLAEAATRGTAMHEPTRDRLVAIIEELRGLSRQPLAFINEKALTDERRAEHVRGHVVNARYAIEGAKRDADRLSPRAKAGALEDLRLREFVIDALDAAQESPAAS